MLGFLALTQPTYPYLRENAYRRKNGLYANSHIIKKLNAASARS